MKTRIIGFWAVAAVLAAGPSWAAEPDSPKAADEWRGRRVLASSPQVVLREQPNDEAPASSISVAGIWLAVTRSEREWLETDLGWILAADVVRAEEAIEHFTAELARKETAFAYLARSRAWLEHNDFDKAQADVSEALRLEPNNARAYLARSRIAGTQQLAEEERAGCDRALEIDPRDPFALQTRAGLKAEAGEYDRAIGDLDLAIEALPKSSQLRSARGFCRASKGDDDQALADFNDAIQLDPLDGYALATRAAIYLRRQDLEKAQRDAEDAVRANPKLAEAFAIRGAAHAIKEEWDAALADLDEAIRLDATDAVAFHNRGSVHYFKGQYDAAVLDYTQAISLNPDDADSYSRRAEIWSKKGDAANAIIDLAQYLRLRPQDANAYVKRGWLLNETDADAAIDDFNAALKINPRHVRALLGRGRAWKEKHDLAKAIEDTTAAIDTDSANVEAYVQRGWLRTDTDAEAALKDLNAALELKPRHVDALLARSNLLKRQKKFAEALDDATAAIEADKTNADTYAQRGWVFTKTDIDRAQKDFDAALEIDPRQAGALLGLSLVWERKHDMAKAIEHASAAIAADAGYADAYLQRAHLCKGADPDAALKDIGAALKINPSYVSALMLRAFIARRKGNRDHAIADITAALEIDPQNADAYIQRGWLLEANDVDAALSDFNAALAVDPRSIDALLGRAEIWKKKGEREKATADFNAVIEIDPKNATAYFNRGRLRGEKDVDGALKDFDVALEIDPRHVNAYVQRGWLRRTTDAVAALKDFDAALAIDPRCVDALVQRAYVWEKEDDWDKALADFGTVIEIDPKNADAYVQRGWLRTKKDFNHAALRDFDKALEIDPRCVNAFVQRGWLRKTTDPDAALSDFDAALAIEPRSIDALLGRAEIWEVKKERDKALADLDAAIDVDPKNTRTRVKRAELAASSGENSRPEGRLVAVRVRGPEGLMLTREQPGAKPFDGEPHPLPEHLALPPGAAMRFQLSGPPLAAGGPVYARLTLPPADDASLATTVFAVTLSSSDLEAASAGKLVTRVVYLGDATDGGATRLQSVSSAELEPGQDPIAQASKQGLILAVVLLSQSADLPSLTEPPAAGAGAEAEGQPDKTQTTQFFFRGLEGMAIQWNVTGPRRFDSEPLVVPGRFNFPKSEIYALKLSQIPGHEGVEIYPTLEVAPPLPRTEAYLEHNAIPIELTAEDIDHVLKGKWLTKVVYLPDPAEESEPQNGVETLVSSRLPSDLDPILEADRRGAILAIIRMGTKPEPVIEKLNAPVTAEGDDAER